jgi:ABC-type branched-subunit amino acid transport system substrate-binding protein
VSTQRTLPAVRFVSDLLEPRLRGAGALGPRDPMRVVFVRQRNQYGLSMAEAIAKSLSLNGRSALSNGDNFAQLVYDDPNESGSRPDYTAVVTELLRLSPHVIIYAGEEELVANVFAPVERAWRGKGRGPYWVSVTNLMGKPLLEFLGADAERRGRFFGISTPERNPPNAQLAMHYSSEFAKMDVNDTPAASYDAAYLVAYATYAAGEVPLDGRVLAAALARLAPPGKPVDVGPTHIFEGIDRLRRGENADLVGADTKLDFDPATGETAVDLVIQCLGKDAKGRASDAIESGLAFDPATGKLDGALACP